MFVDASAIVAIINREPKSLELLSALDDARGTKYCSPFAKYEAVAGFARCKPKSIKNHANRILESQIIVSRFLENFDITLVATQPDVTGLAIEAFAKYGRGSGHPAKLNMGDCFAYAMAKSLKVPLLFIGNDFIHTDIKSALKDPSV